MSDPLAVAGGSTLTTRYRRSRLEVVFDPLHNRVLELANVIL